MVFWEAQSTCSVLMQRVHYNNTRCDTNCIHSQTFSIGKNIGIMKRNCVSSLTVPISHNSIVALFMVFTFHMKMFLQSGIHNKFMQG